MTNCFEGNDKDEEIQKAIEIIKIGSVVKENLIKQTQKEVTTYLMNILKAVTTEQTKMGLTDESEKDYILDAVFDAALRRGYIQ
jgi:citrate lyase gamma subunit